MAKILIKIKVFGPKNARSASEICKECGKFKVIIWWLKTINRQMNFAVLGRFKFFRSFSFSFFHAKLKFDVDVTGPLQEIACCLKSWL